MPRIKRKDIYPLQDPIFPDDYWIGSMGESTATPGKTKNFAASAVLAYILENIGIPEGSQDNIGVYRDISYDGDNTFDAIADAINASPAFTVSVYNDMWFRVVNTKVGSTRAGLFRMINTGKGNYGTGGDIDLEATDLQFVCSVALEVDDFSELVGTELVNYGDLTGTTVEEWLNAQAEVIIQSQEDGYTIFYGTIDGEEMQYLWIGEGGTYGTGNPTATSNDFQLLAGVGGVIPTTPVPNLQQVTDEGYLTTKPLISALANLRSTVNAGIVSAANTSTNRFTEMSPAAFKYSQAGSANVLSIEAPTLDAGIKTQTYQNKSGTIALLSDLGDSLCVALNISGAEIIESEIYFSSPRFTGVTFGYSEAGGDKILTIDKTAAFVLGTMVPYPKISFNIKRMSDNNDSEDSDVWIQDQGGSVNQVRILGFDSTVGGVYILNLTAYN